MARSERPKQKWADRLVFELPKTEFELCKDPTHKVAQRETYGFLCVTCGLYVKSPYN